MKAEKALFKKGTKAMRTQTPSSALAQCRLQPLKKASTPLMEKRGRNAETEDHLALESGKKLGYAGMSGGKKKLEKIRPYRWTLP